MASSQVADLKELTIKTQGFQGGINLRDAADQLQPNELRKAENVVYDAAGGFAKRPGSRGMGTIGIAAERIISMYTFYRGTSNPQVLAHTNQGKMYYTNDVTANPTVWTQITAGLSTTVPACFETENSKCYFAEGTVMGSWDGAAYTTVVAAPAGIYFLRVWKDTMWGATLTNPDRVYSSSAGDPTTWPAANFVDILHGDGDKVACIASDGLFLIVFKIHRAQVVYDPALFSNRTADFEKGCESHFSVVHMEDKLYYLSRLGVCWWQGDSSSRLISYKIDPLFNPDILDLSKLSSVQTYQRNDRCGWILPEVVAGGGTTYVIIEYYPRLGPIYQISGNIGPGPWSMHRIDVSCFTTVRQGGVENIYAGARSSNKMWWVFSPDGTDDGAVVNSTVESAPLDFGNPVLTKYFRRVTLLGRGKFNLQFKRNYQNQVYNTYTVDLSTGQTVWNSGNWNVGAWGPDSNVKRKVQGVDLYGVAFSICITDSEITTGTQLFPVGSVDHSLVQGEWAIYQLAFDGFMLGLRG